MRGGRLRYMISLIRESGVEVKDALDACERAPRIRYTFVMIRESGVEVKLVREHLGSVTHLS